MALKTKPIRIFESDHQPLRLIAEAEGRKPSEVFHDALLGYMATNRNELANVFEETRAAIADGDLERLTALASRGIDAEAAALANHDHL